MFRIEYELAGLTCEEMTEVREQLQRMLEELSEYEHDRAVLLSEEEKHVIAQALAIDELTGEWEAGA